MPCSARAAASAILLLTALAAGAAETHLWVEGESAKTRQLVDNAWYNSVKKGNLSGGAWVSNWGPEEGRVAYDVTAPADGAYVLWVRANPIGTELSVQVGDGAWKPIDLGKPVDNINIADNDAPDMRFIAWFHAGEVALRKGVNAVAFRMTSANNHCGAIDCFLLTTSREYTPSGSSQPGRKLGLAAPGTWAFEPDADDFDARAVLDLRALNEKQAGESGWMTRTADGDFALGNGKPYRLWAANTTLFEQSDAALAAHARFIAKRGVNMVRFHGHFQPPAAGSKVTDVDDGQIDQCQRLVAAMKREGIYTTVSMFWATSGAQASWSIPGHAQGAMFGLLFWDETLQKGYKAWVKELLTRRNPHGVPLGQEPALAILQLQNEDSLLFWTFGTIQGEEKQRLMKIHGDWAAKKYGSLAKAQAAWGGKACDGDDVAAGRAGFLGMWEFDGELGQRQADQLQWMGETMRGFDQMMDDYVHQELGCKVLINAGNWRTANQVKMLDVERWSYGANQVTGVNRYVAYAHVGSGKEGYLVQRGDCFEDASALLRPRTIPTNAKQVAGSPYIISESTWVSPLSYQSEAPFLVAAYSSLTGMDAYYWFSLGAVGYDRTIVKFQAANPAIMGGFPAAALLYRKGYVKKGAPAVHEERALDDVWKAKGLLIAEEEGFDPNRDTGAVARESTVQKGADPLAFLVGPVEAVYGGDPKKNQVVDFAKYIDPAKKRVTSDTGELVLDHGDGWCTLDAPKAQGATGFLGKAGKIALKTIAIDSADAYATYLVVALDDKDLKDSQKILLQATTTCRPYGWKQVETDFKDHEGKQSFHGFRIDDTGQEPWNVAEARATITVANPKLKKATQLDANGMAVKPVAVEAKAGKLTVKLPPDALYLVLE